MGVQYELNALQNHVISVNEFLNLNKVIGGYDHHGDIQAARMVANADALETIYRTGRVNVGAGGIPNLPIIDVRNYVDNEVNVHQYINTYRFRSRLLESNGTYANQVMFRASGGQNVKAMDGTALDTMATWLDQIKSDTSNRSQAQKVIGDNNLCETTYPPHSLPDLEAGKPLKSPIGKCPLRAINPAGYPALSPTQEQTLASIFTGGVCNFSKPGVGEQPLAGTWLSVGPRQMITQRRRGISLKARPRRLRRGARTNLTADLSPCPAATWKNITLERRLKGRWRPLATRIANGANCRPRVRTRVTRVTRSRVRARSISGCAGAGPERRVVRLRG